MNIYPLLAYVPCHLPFAISGFSCLPDIRQCWEHHKIKKLLTSVPCDHPIILNNSPCIDSFIETTSNSKKLAMLSAWQTTNSKAPILMDYAPRSKAICIDTGASSCISNDRTNFISFSTVTDQVISGISSGLSVEGCGTLHWNIRDDDGNNIILHISDALYIPTIPICLLCPQQVAKQTGLASDGFTAGGTHGTFTYDGFTRTVPGTAYCCFLQLVLPMICLIFPHVKMNTPELYYPWQFL
jgi:hypothetical protein